MSFFELHMRSGTIDIECIRFSTHYVFSQRPGLRVAVDVRIWGEAT